jgi:hypothetical protein
MQKGNCHECGKYRTLDEFEYCLDCRKMDVVMAKDFYDHHPAKFIKENK